jgi:hypothetical protein
VNDGWKEGSSGEYDGGDVFMSMAVDEETGKIPMVATMIASMAMIIWKMISWGRCGASFERTEQEPPTQLATGPICMPTRSQG